MKVRLVKIVFALTLLLMTFTAQQAAAYCNAEATLSLDEASAPTQYGLTASYTSTPATGWRVSSATYTLSCTVNGTTCLASEFSTSASSATLTPSQSATYTITNTPTIQCYKYSYPHNTIDNETSQAATQSIVVTLPAAETGDDDTGVDDTGDDDDTAVEETCTPSVSYYPDVDADNYGDVSGTAILFCTDATTTETAGYVANNTDCDDASGSVHPGVSEDVRDYIDNNCDGIIADYVAPATGTTPDPDDGADPATTTDDSKGGCSLNSNASPYNTPLGLALFFAFASLLCLRHKISSIF